MTSLRQFPYVSVIPNSANNLTAQVLFAGGSDNNNLTSNTAEVYDSVFGTFTALTAPMTKALSDGYALPAR
jgi:hypothetical protein